VVLSTDFVWATSGESSASGLQEEDFSIRLDSPTYLESGSFRLENCEVEDRKGQFEDELLLLEKLKSVSDEEIVRLQEGGKRAAAIYSFYPLNDNSMTDAPLLDGASVNGGGAANFIRELELRMDGQRASECVEELGGVDFRDVPSDELKIPRTFVC